MKSVLLILFSISAMMFFLSCRKPYFQYEQPPLVLKQYYEGGWIGGHAKWWWNIYIHGKKFSLPDGESDFHYCYLGPAKDPPNILIAKSPAFYMLRVVNGKTDLMKLDKTSEDKTGWALDGLGYVFKGQMLDMRTGEITALKKFPGNFLGFSPDGMTIISVEYDWQGQNDYILYMTNQQTGETNQQKFNKQDYKWLGDWRSTPKPTYAPNLRIFNHIRWKKNDQGQYDMIIPKDTELNPE